MIVQIQDELLLPIKGRILLYKSVLQNNLINLWQWNNRHIFFLDILSYILEVDFDILFELESGREIDLYGLIRFISSHKDIFSIRKLIALWLLNQYEYMSADDVYYMLHNIDVDITLYDEELKTVYVRVRLLGCSNE